MKIFIIFYRFLSFFKIVLNSFFYKNKIFLFSIPLHGNLGDQALLYAEECFFSEKLENYKLIKIDSAYIYLFPLLLKRIIGKSTIFVHSGGFLGNLWINEERNFREILKIFSNNKIIVLPQSIYFSNDEDGFKEIQVSKSFYESHNNLVFFVRETFSFDFMKKNFSKCKTILVPDMALYLDLSRFNFERKPSNSILYCIRNDKEKVINDFEELTSFFVSKGMNICYTDTVINKMIFDFNRKKELSKKISEFYNSKLVITDRLHGMIFSLISGTPCIAYPNLNRKIEGVYSWIRDYNNIILYNKSLDFDKDVFNIIDNKFTYDSGSLKEKFNIIIHEFKDSD